MSKRATAPNRAHPYHHGNLRRALLDAALESIAAAGPAALSLRELARRVGVSHAAPAHHFGDKAGLLTALATEGYRVPAGEVYQMIESPRGQLGFYIISDGSGRPYRVHVRAPSFMNLQALAKIAEGRLFADLIAIVASLDPVMGEVDR